MEWITLTKWQKFYLSLGEQFIPIVFAIGVTCLLMWAIGA